jgi:hypothetical protein
LKHIGAGKDADAGAVAGPQAMRMRALVRRETLVPAWAAARGLGRALFRAQDFGRGGISLLLLADNYNLTTADRTAEAQSTQRTNGRRRLLLRSRAPFFQVLTNKQIERLCELCDSAVNNRKTFKLISMQSSA